MADAELGRWSPTSSLGCCGDGSCSGAEDLQGPIRLVGLCGLQCSLEASASGELAPGEIRSSVRLSVLRGRRKPLGERHTPHVLFGCGEAQGVPLESMRRYERRSGPSMFNERREYVGDVCHLAGISECEPAIC